MSKKSIDLPTFLRIKQWLFGNPGYHRLQIEDEWFSDFYFNCILKASEDIKFGGEYFGLRCSVECDSPYAYTSPQTKTYTFDSSIINYFEFDNFSAEIYGLRPIIEFKMMDLMPNEIIRLRKKSESNFSKA